MMKKFFSWSLWCLFVVGMAMIMAAIFNPLNWQAPKHDRDAWLVTKCDRPVLVMFLDERGTLEQFAITGDADLVKHGKRMLAAPHKYTIEVKQDCMILTAEAL
jgi:hypothetical protein